MTNEVERRKKIDKINKLLLLAEENQNPGERRAARAKAYQLMNEYDIDESEISFFCNNNETKVKEESKNRNNNHDKIIDKLKTWKNFQGTKTVLGVIKFLGLFIIELIKIPLVWQSLFVIGWFGLMFQLLHYLYDQGNPGTGWMLVIGSIFFFWYWLRNFIIAFVFLIFLYFVSTTSIDLLISKIF